MDSDIETPVRLATLETRTESMLRELVDLRTDLRTLRADMRTDFRTLFGALIVVALGLAGLMPRGFHWV